jgi:hypothetical protein
MFDCDQVVSQIPCLADGRKKNFCKNIFFNFKEPFLFVISQEPFLFVISQEPFLLFYKSLFSQYNKISA